LVWKKIRQSLRNKTLIQDLATAKAKTMAQGLVETRGKVKGKEFTNSHFSHTKCFYFFYLREKFTPNGWQKTFFRKGYTPFFLKNNSGNVKIKLEKADMHHPFTYQFLERKPQNEETPLISLEDDRNIKQQIKKNIREFIPQTSSLYRLETNNIKAHNDDIVSRKSIKKLLNHKSNKNPQPNFRIGDIRHTEYCLLPNDNIYILGEFRDNSIHYSESEEVFVFSSLSEENKITQSLKKEIIILFLSIIFLVYFLYLIFIAK
jgi:hypothetical protein